jgi:hypothetical protein
MKDALRKLFKPHGKPPERYPIPPQHRHCGYCGAKMAKLPDGTGIKCTRCGNVVKVMID